MGRMLVGSLKNRWERAVVGALAVLLGAALVAAFTHLSWDVGRQVGQELRAYGANILLTPKAAALAVGLGGLELGTVAEERYLREEDLAGLRAAPFILGYAPSLYAIVEVRGQRVVLAGTRFEGVKAISPWWRLEGRWVKEGEEDASLVGATAAQKLGLGLGDTFTVEYKGRALASGKGRARSLTVVGLVETGGAEDQQVLVDLRVAQDLTGLPGMVGLVQVSALAGDRPLAAIARELEAAIPGARAQAVGQIAQAEAAVRGKVQLLVGLVAAMVLWAAGLAVMGTMATAVLERAGEIGLMKALGAGNPQVALLFLGEAGVIAAVGGLAGYGVGLGIALGLERAVFGASAAPSPWTLPATLAVALTVTILASLLPIRRALQIEPAITLRGE